MLLSSPVSRPGEHFRVMLAAFREARCYALLFRLSVGEMGFPFSLPSLKPSDLHSVLLASQLCLF